MEGRNQAPWLRGNLRHYLGIGRPVGAGPATLSYTQGRPFGGHMAPLHTHWAPVGGHMAPRRILMSAPLEDTWRSLVGKPAPCRRQRGDVFEHTTQGRRARVVLLQVIGTVCTQYAWCVCLPGSGCVSNSYFSVATTMDRVETVVLRHCCRT